MRMVGRRVNLQQPLRGIVHEPQSLNCLGGGAGQMGCVISVHMLSRVEMTACH